MTRESKEPLWQRETLGEERQDTPDPLGAWPPIDDAHDDDADWEGEWDYVPEPEGNVVAMPDPLEAALRERTAEGRPFQGPAATEPRMPPAPAHAVAPDSVPASEPAPRAADAAAHEPPPAPGHTDNAVAPESTPHSERAPEPAPAPTEPDAHAVGAHPEPVSMADPAPELAPEPAPSDHGEAFGPDARSMPPLGMPAGEHHDSAPSSPQTPRAARKGMSRRAWWWLAGVVVCVAAVIVGLAVWLSRPASDPLAGLFSADGAPRDAASAAPDDAPDAGQGGLPGSTGTVFAPTSTRSTEDVARIPLEPPRESALHEELSLRVGEDGVRVNDSYDAVATALLLGYPTREEMRSAIQEAVQSLELERSLAAVGDRVALLEETVSLTADALNAMDVSALRDTVAMLEASDARRAEQVERIAEGITTLADTVDRLTAAPAPRRTRQMTGGEELRPVTDWVVRAIANDRAIVASRNSTRAFRVTQGSTISGCGLVTEINGVAGEVVTERCGALRRPR